MNVTIGGDHNGVELRHAIVQKLRLQGYHVNEIGPSPTDGIVDYPAICLAVTETIIAGNAARGILIGGMGNGEVILANKVPGIRAALAVTVESVQIARSHNDTNVLVVGAKLINVATALELCSVWLTTLFEGGRHKVRLDAIRAIEDRTGLQ